MRDKVFLVHGWSVTETTTYQALHLKLAEHGYELHDIYLGRYVSLDDHVEVKDLSAAMHKALCEHLGDVSWDEPFHIITHSTGALVTKEWVVKHYRDTYSNHQPLKNIVFLAGPHFGSRLAHHGRAMIAQIVHLGDTGKKILNALELGSRFSWENNSSWMNPTNWKDKGIRPFNLIGDRIERNLFKSKIFPAAYEKGSDMVVRNAAANLNCRRYKIDAAANTLELINEISGVPFASFSEFVHSGKNHGIMNSIKKRTDPGDAKGESLKTILACLAVKTNADYDRVRNECSQITTRTRTSKKAFAQLDFWFHDQTGSPIEDYLFTLGAIVGGKRKPSKTVAHIHKNKINGSHLTVFVDLKEFEPQYTYFMKFDAKSETDLVTYEPDPYEITIDGAELQKLISPDQTTQIEVVLTREQSRNLFVFHTGDDPKLHVKWNRDGEIKKKRINPK